jgi:DNA-binding transcriptional LysR family regulator
VHITVPSLLHLPLVLRGTRLVATMPERVAQMFASTLAVKTFPLPFETPALHEILLWHKRNDSDPAHTWLRDLVVRLTQEM